MNEERLLLNFQNLLKSGNVIETEESMVASRGKFPPIHSKKTHKYGLKLYKLCSPERYTINLPIYSGKRDTQANLGHLQLTVPKLLEP